MSRAANEVHATIPKPLVPKPDALYRGLDLRKAAAETLVCMVAGATWVVAWASAKSGVGSRLHTSTLQPEPSRLVVLHIVAFLEGERRLDSWSPISPSINHRNPSSRDLPRRGSTALWEVERQGQEGLGTEAQPYSTDGAFQ
jgi:hypothetical protein